MSILNTCLIVVISSLTMYASVANAARYSLKSSIDAQAAYDDNIFLANNSEDVVRLTLVPALSASVSEQNWQQSLDLKAVANLYSEDQLDNNDAILDYSAVLGDERKSYNLNAGYNKDSNLNASSLDFGLGDQLVKSTTWNIGPGFQYRWTERLSLLFSANTTTKEYDENTVNGFIGYQADVGRASASYVLDERTSLLLQTQYTEYESEDGAFTYELLSNTVGLDHALTEIWSFSGSIGRSSRNSTTVNAQPVTIFGQTFTVLDEIDVETTDKVLDLTLSGKYPASNVSLSYLENDQTNSFGGLNRVRYTRFGFGWKPAERWAYKLSARHDVTQAVLQGNQNTDRTLNVVSLSATYKLALNWRLTAKYSFRRLEFDNLAGSTTPESNTLTLGLRYEFRELSSD